MNRKLVRGIGIGLAVLAVGYVVVDLFLGSVVKAGINEFAPRLTQTRVVLAGAHLSPLTGGGELSGFVVGNPKGWSENSALSFGKIHVAVAPFSLFGDHIVIKDVEITDPEFNYETHFVSSNIGDLLNRLQDNAGGNDAPTAKNGQPLKFEVRHFRLQGGKVRLGVGPTALVLPMPPIELDNLGTAEGGITANQLAFAVMRSVTTGVVSATRDAVGKVGSTVGAAAEDNAKKALDGLKGLFSGKN